MPIERRRNHVPNPAHAPAATLAANQAEHAQALDVIWGCEAIAAVIRRPVRATYHLLQKQHLPARKVGSNWVAERGALLRHLSGGVS
jgi:hypothetical protein